MTTPDDDSPPTTNMADHEEDAQGEGALHQCASCDRKFNTQSYERHVKICERTAAKKRKPFDSAKQRIQGTDLAEFVHTKPPETLHEHHHHHHHPPTRRPSHAGDDKPAAASGRRSSGAWKEKSDELRRSIKAVKDKTQQSTPAASQTSSPLSSTHQSTNQHHQQQQQQQQRPSTLSLVTSPGAPQRSNEKGTCPTCQRQFGVKSYDRHVAFCRERATRLPSSPQTSNNVAKERLDARMKYRAPGLKNRKPTNKEKYSPGGVQQQQPKVAQSPLMARSKNVVVDSPKLPQLKRPGQTKESPISTSGPLKSRPMDRSNRSSDSQESLNPPAMRQLFASRRLLLLSEVLPSKVLQSKKSSLSSSSSQKSSARLVTSFLQKEFHSEDACSPYAAKPERESLKQKLKKKIRFRARSSKKIRVEDEEEQETAGEQIEMVELTGAQEQNTRDYVTWQQIREEVRSNKHDCESIDKIEEPILSHRTGLSSVSRDDDDAGGNSTMDEFEMNEKMVRYHETEGCFVIENNADEENEGKKDSTALDRTYVVEDTTRLENVQDEENKEDENANESEDDDDLSVASTKTFKKSDCENVGKIEIHETEQDDEVTPRIHENSESKRDDTSPQAVDGEDELTIVTNKIKEKLLNRPKKYLSLPNIADMQRQRTPRVSRLNVEGAEIKEDANKDQAAHDPTRLPLVNCPTRRCATYVVDKPSGDNGSKSKSRLETRDSKLLYDYYRNDAASFSDMSSVRTEDLQITDYDFEDFTDGNESNASELLKEIDACLMNSSLLESQDSVDFGRKARTRAERRCRNARATASLNERDEETSESTIELADLRSEKHQFEKEICTITRLDAISRDNSSFLPPIAANRATEYRREKFVKSKALRDIAERDTPRDDEDERFERFPKSRARSRRHSERRSHLRRSYERLPRCDLNSYIRRHPNFSVLLKSRIGNNYDPFYLLAEQQLNDLFSDTSDQSSTDGSSICPPQKTNSSPNFPLTLHSSSAFAKYPTAANGTANPASQTQPQSLPTPTANGADKQQPPQRASVIAPPTGFDDLTSSDLSSDCTETNSLSRELLTSSSNSNSLAGSRIVAANNGEREHVLGRRIIIDQNQALGGGEFAPSSDALKSNGTSNGVHSNGVNSRFSKPLASCNRSNSMRAVSAPKPPERKTCNSSSSSSTNSDFLRNNNKLKSDMTRSANNFKNQLNSSNVSLNSIFSSSDMEMKRSASLFDELLSSFEDDANSTSTLPSLMSLIRNDPLLSGSAPPQQQQQQNGHHQRTTNNGRINCSDDDAELSSPESVKRQECGKLSADSAYSSLNRKYSNHGRSTNDVSNTSSKYKMSKFCHECGFKFPDSAKFCCECGVRRLTL